MPLLSHGQCRFDTAQLCLYHAAVPPRRSIGIVVTSHECIDQLNSLLSEYGSYIIGRMGIPYKEKNVSVISITLDAPNDIISALSGKIGMLPGINTKTIYAKTN